MGSASALLLVSLEWAKYREHHLWIIALLPVAGFAYRLDVSLLGRNSFRGKTIT